MAALAVVAALAAGCTSSGGSSTAASAPATSPPTQAGVPVAGSLAQVPGIAARLEPSVVTIRTPNGTGSGVVYAPDGLIVTNEHVVRGNRDVGIAFADGRRVPGQVQATDAVTDLALVRTDRKDLPPAEFETRLPAVGSLAVVIGSPLGFQNTVTAGIVSGLHREVPGSASAGQQSLVDLLQTDAPISPGNSGGAVVDAAGKVVGISEAYIPPSAGAVAIGFAIPAATVVDIVDQLRRDGRARHAFAGLAPAAISPEIAQQLGLSDTRGVIVAGVASGGPADRAGLAPGDIVRVVDGQPVATPEDFLAALRPHDPGDVLTLAVTRPGAGERQVRITVVDRPLPSS